jgi:hypothetical protein
MLGGLAIGLSRVQRILPKLYKYDSETRETAVVGPHWSVMTKKGKKIVNYSGDKGADVPVVAAL